MSLLYPSRRNLLLSYPRSGNTFIRYCVEQSTGKRTLTFVRPEFQTEEGLQILVAMGMGKMDSEAISEVDNQEVILEKAHEMLPGDEVVFNKETGGRVILILRDFKEAIGRQALGREFNYMGHIPIYKSALEFYDNYQGDKLVVYYEDFVQNTELELKKLLEFIGEYNHEKYMAFIGDIETQKENSIKTYNKFHSSITKGKSFSHYVNNFTQEQLDHMNIELRHPLTERYFTND